MARCKCSDTGATGLTGDREESKVASSGRPDLPVSVFLLPAARDRVP